MRWPLLLLVLVLCSSYDVCEGRRGQHWRSKNAPSTSMLMKKKGKGKPGGGGQSGQQQLRHPSPPLPSPSAGKGFGYPTPRTSPAPTLTPSNSGGGRSGQQQKQHSTPPLPSPGAGKGFGHPTPRTSPAPTPVPSNGKVHLAPPGAATGCPTLVPKAVVHNVVDYGAMGDGVTDDTKAFQAAWAAACKVEASTVLVPGGLEFLVGPISFSGPSCEPNIVFQLEGTIVAPNTAKAWGSGLLQWIEFTKLRGITIQGSGTIEGRGNVWWTYTDADVDPIREELVEKMPQIKPTALRFYGSTNVTVTGVTIQNSPQCHLKFDSCQFVAAYNITISSPGNSLNTDGIHLQNSRDITIHHSNIGCGDDCVSIQTGCTDVNIHTLDCGPGHGISIGGLGRDNTKACVSNITVRDINMHNTMTGVRIKTWQGGSGSAQGIRFSNIRVTEVQTPIIIDQFYCDRASCINQTSAVAISGVQYENIRGTYTIKPVHFACSDSSPCSDITLTGVQLQPLKEQYQMYSPFCWHAYGELYTPTVPPIACLQNGKPASNRVQSEHDTC